MTLSENIFDDYLPTTSTTHNAANLDSLYCSHLWKDSCLRSDLINALQEDNQIIKYCYTCKGKIRKYDLTTLNRFLPNSHSTPNKKITADDKKSSSYELQAFDGFSNVRRSRSKDDIDGSNDNTKKCIPSISHQIDSNILHKYVSHETNDETYDTQRLRKTPSGMGCVVDFALTESPVKKRKQIQACSISVMILAIVVISFILVNFTTPNLIHAMNSSSTIVVPTVNSNNKTSSAITKIYIDLPLTDDPGSSRDYTSEASTSTDYILSTLIVENITENASSVLSKIRKNIRTYPRHKNHSNPKPKDIINRAVSQRFCSCQSNEICMLDENSGTSLCRVPIDDEDPTGCGGLCALETEACQLVDKARGVRVCRLLTMISCSIDEWRCRNGLCVSANRRCDGSIQCYDRSDEMHCECDLTKQFRCGHSISCFPNSKLCDGVIDCWDGYDEVNCTTECPSDQFTCTDGQCIASARFCDGFTDCADGSDEPDGCGHCGTHEMQCKNQRCVPLVVLCDGEDNCGDATDELDCHKLSSI